MRRHRIAYLFSHRWTLGCFWLLAAVDHAAVNRGCTYPFRAPLPLPLGADPEVGLQGHRATLFNFVRTCQTIPTAAVAPATREDPSSPTSLPAVLSLMVAVLTALERPCQAAPCGALSPVTAVTGPCCPHMLVNLQPRAVAAEHPCHGRTLKSEARRHAQFHPATRQGRSGPSPLAARAGQMALHGPESTLHCEEHCASGQNPAVLGFLVPPGA